MTDPLFLLALVGLAPALVSVLIAILFKKYIKPNKPDTFKQTLKFGLLGTLLGLMIFVILWTIHKNETNSWAAPGDISVIPFYTMLAGVFLGVYLTNRTAFSTAGKASSYGTLGFLYFVLGLGFDNPYSKAVFLIASLLFFVIALRARSKNKAES
ncbi:hypothetical protein [Spirosoma fluviale]|uniref:Uncharacterized protein n=1 Tax=Spirosoma fluviale TaxID=1597977 RepID=A0A286GK12_9BACT|nr:hypothetical protein [Spirosoma fluviale]SOD95840.1 hypothetical protein SAMN06269250_5008 [Spirosoma fluviale]